MQLFPKLLDYINTLDPGKLSKERLVSLQALVNYIQDKKNSGELIHLNFICTHNSRRSQLSQVWAQVMITYFEVAAKCYSGGVEVTAFNERAISSLKSAGFKVEKEGEVNPYYSVFFSVENEPLLAFSKLFDDEVNPKGAFAAIMTCAEADANCPFIPGAYRISLPYDDPKDFDDSPVEAEKYDERSHQIATELFYVFSQIN